MSLLYGHPTGATRRDGTPHRQPRAVRRAWCHITGGHRPKFDAHPSGSCIRCQWWPHQFWR